VASEDLGSEEVDGAFLVAFGAGLGCVPDEVDGLEALVFSLLAGTGSLGVQSLLSK
jgi:hypothetical protein